MNSRIDSLMVDVYEFPTETMESDATFEWNSTTLVLVKIQSADIVGIGYTYADKSCAVLIKSLLLDCVVGENCMRIASIWNKMHAAVRNNGHQGLTAMAISAVDLALWDLKAKLLRISVPELVGKVRTHVDVYGSGGFCSFSKAQLRKQISGFLNLGIKAIKIKVGRADLALDLQRVEYAMELIGEKATLLVDANGAYVEQEALQAMYDYANRGVNWFEEPVGMDNVDGLSYLKQKAPSNMEIAAGEYGYDTYTFLRLAKAQAMHVSQIDVTRCGGITNFLKIYGLLSSFNLPISTHTAPALHRSLGLCLKNIRHCEYFSDHASIELKIFDGFSKPTNGCLFFPEGRLGLGLSINEQQISSFQTNI